MCSKRWFLESPEPPTIKISGSVNWLHKIPSQTPLLYSDNLKQDSLTRKIMSSGNEGTSLNFFWGCKTIWEVK